MYFLTAMGKPASKPSNEKPRMVPRAKKQLGLGIRLLVLHKNETEPEEIRKLGGKIREYPPPGSISVDEKISKIPDDGQLEEPLKSWVTEWLGLGRVVLVWLLSDCDVNAAFGDHDKLMVTRITPNNMKAELDDLVVKIRARGQ